VVASSKLTPCCLRFGAAFAGSRSYSTDAPFSVALRCECGPPDHELTGAPHQRFRYATPRARPVERMVRRHATCGLPGKHGPNQARLQAIGSRMRQGQLGRRFLGCCQPQATRQDSLLHFSRVKLAFHCRSCLFLPRTSHDPAEKPRPLENDELHRFRIRSTGLGAG
jgi:hypothetical protein